MTSVGAGLKCGKGSGMGLICSTPRARGSMSSRMGVLSRRLTQCPITIKVTTISSKTYRIRFSLTTRGKVPVMTFSSKASCRGVMSVVSASGAATTTATTDGLYGDVNRDNRVLMVTRSSGSASSRRERRKFMRRIRGGSPGMAITRV